MNSNTVTCQHEPRGALHSIPNTFHPHLLLHALRENDLDDLYAYASAPEIDRLTPWTHYQSLAEARADLDDYLAEYETNSMGAWGAEIVAAACGELRPA